MADVLLTFDGDLSPIERKINNLSNRSIKLDLKNNLSQPLGRISADVSEFNKSLEASNARVLAFGASAGAVYAVQRAFSEIVKSTIEVEKSLTDINVVLGASGKTLGEFGRSLFDIAKNTGTSFSQVASAATELSRQGLSVQETLRRTSDALILTRLSGLDAAKSVEALTAAVNSFGRAGLTTTEIVNKFATVDAAFAVSSADLAEAISRVGSTAQDVGVSLDQLVGLVTAAQQTTARGGSVIGNSFKTIFTRIQRTDTLDQLEALGIKVRDLQGNALPAVQVLQNLAGTFSTLSSAQKSSLAETVGGVYQMNILRATLGDLSKQYSVYGAALNTSLGATDQAKKRNEELNQTLSAMINKTMVNFKQASAEIGNLVFAPTIKSGTGLLDSILADFSKPEEARSAGGQVATQLLKGIGEFLQGPGLTLVGAAFVKIFAGLTTFSAQAFKGLMGITSGADQLAAAQARVNSILAQNPNLIQAVITKNASLLQVENQILQIIQQQNQARIAGSQLSTKLAPAVVKAETAAVVAIAGSKAPKKGRAKGFIPNFSLDPEIEAANKLGYYPSNSFEINHPILGKTTVNDKEKTNAVQVGKYPPGSFIVNPKQENKMKGIPLTDIVSYASGYVPNFQLGTFKEFVENSPQIIDATNTATMLVPEGGTGTAQYLFKENKKTGEPEKRVTWPVINLNKNYKDGNVITNIEKRATDVASSLMRAFSKSIRPPARVIADSEIENRINEAGGAKGSINSFAGAIFEAGVKLALDYQAAQKEGLDFDVIGKTNVLDGLFPGLSTSLADFKINSTSASNRKSMAEKILKARNLGYVGPDGKADLNKKIDSNKKQRAREKPKRWRVNNADGFIPNFEDDTFAIMESFIREEEALKSRSGEGKIKLGKDSRLISPENPEGYGVYNTLDEPTGLKEGIERYKSISQAKKAGKASGFIPNFAKEQEIDPNKEKNSKLFMSLLAGSFIGSQAKAYGRENLDTLGGQTAFSTGSVIEGAASSAIVSELFGGKGMKTAIVATSITSLVKSINEIRTTQARREIDNLNKELQTMQDKINNLSSTSQNFTTKLTELNAAMEEGKDTSSIKRDLLKTIQELPLEQRKEALDKYQKGPSEVVEYLNQAGQIMRSIQTDKVLTRGLKEMNPAKVGLGDQLSNALGGSSNPFGNFIGKYFGTTTTNPLLNPDNIDLIGNSLMGNINTASNIGALSNEEYKQFGSNVASANSSKEFIDALQKISEKAKISSTTLSALQNVLSAFPQSADRVKNSVLENIRTNLIARKESELSKMTYGGETNNYKGASQIIDYDYLQSPFGKEDRVGRLSSAGIMYAGINPFQDKSKQGQAALQASSIMGEMGYKPEEIGKIFPDIKEKSIQFLSDSFDKETEDIVAYGKTGNLGRFNEEAFRESRKKIKSDRLAEAAYGEKNPVSAGQVPDITQLGTTIQQANEALNKEIKAKADAIDKAIQDLDKTIQNLTKKIEENKNTEETSPGGPKDAEAPNQIIKGLIDTLTSSIGPAITIGLSSLLINLIKGKGASTAATALETAASSGMKLVPRGAAAAAAAASTAAATTGAATGTAAAGTAAAGTAAAGTAAAGTAATGSLFLPALAAFLAGGGVGYGVSKIPAGEGQNVGDRLGEGLYSAFPELFGGPSKAQQTKDEEDFRKKIEEIKNKNKQDLQTPTRIKEGDACCREEIDIQKQILKAVEGIKNFLPNLAKTAYIPVGSGAGGAGGGTGAQQTTSNVARTANSNLPESNLNSNNISFLPPNEDRKYSQTMTGLEKAIQESTKSFDNGAQQMQRELADSLLGSNIIANQPTSQYEDVDFKAISEPRKEAFDKESLYAGYAKELQDPNTYKDRKEEQADGRILVKNRSVEIGNEVARIQAEEGYRTKDDRIEERRRTGIEDSGFDKGYLSYEPFYDPTKTSGVGFRQVPEQRILSRNIDPKTGMISNRAADGGSIGMESELRQKELAIYDQTAPKYFAEQLSKERNKERSQSRIKQIDEMIGGYEKTLGEEGTSISSSKHKALTERIDYLKTQKNAIQNPENAKKIAEEYEDKKLAEAGIESIKKEDGSRSFHYPVGSSEYDKSKRINDQKLELIDTAQSYQSQPSEEDMKEGSKIAKTVRSYLVGDKGRIGGADSSGRTLKGREMLNNLRESVPNIDKYVPEIFTARRGYTQNIEGVGSVDQDELTGFELMKQFNRENAPETPAPFMSWNQQGTGKITAAPGSVTPPSFMNENAALPVAPESLLAPYMFQSKKQFLDPSKSLDPLIPGENLLDTPVMAMGNLGANARDYGRGYFGMANPPILGKSEYSSEGGNWAIEPFDISDRYLGAASRNVAQGNLPFKNYQNNKFNDKPLSPGDLFNPFFEMEPEDIQARNDYGGLGYQGNIKNPFAFIPQPSYQDIQKEQQQTGQPIKLKTTETDKGITIEEEPTLSAPKISPTQKTTSKPDMDWVKEELMNNPKRTGIPGLGASFQSEDSQKSGAVNNVVSRIIEQSKTNPKAIDEGLRQLSDLMQQNLPSGAGQGGGGGTFDKQGNYTASSSEVRERIRMAQDELLRQKGNKQEWQNKTSQWRKEAEEKTSPVLTGDEPSSFDINTGRITYQKDGGTITMPGRGLEERLERFKNQKQGFSFEYQQQAIDREHEISLGHTPEHVDKRIAAQKEATRDHPFETIDKGAYYFIEKANRKRYEKDASDPDKILGNKTDDGYSTSTESLLRLRDQGIHYNPETENFFRSDANEISREDVNQGIKDYQDQYKYYESGGKEGRNLMPLDENDVYKDSYSQLRRQTDTPDDFSNQLINRTAAGGDKLNNGDDWFSKPSEIEEREFEKSRDQTPSRLNKQDFSLPPAAPGTPGSQVTPQGSTPTSLFQNMTTDPLGSGAGKGTGYASFVNPQGITEKIFNKPAEEQSSMMSGVDASWKEGLRRMESQGELAQVQGGGFGITDKFVQSMSDQGASSEMVQTLQQIADNTKQQLASQEKTSKSNIDYQDRPKENQKDEDKKEDVRNQEEKDNPNTQIADALKQLTSFLTSNQQNNDNQDQATKSGSEGEGGKGGDISVSVSASSNVNVSAKMDPGEIEGKVKAIVAEEIAKLQSSIESKLAAMQGSPQPPKGRGSSPSATA